MPRGRTLDLEEVDPEGQPVRRSLPRRVLGWFGRHPILVLAAIVILVLLGLGLHWNHLPNYPTLQADKVESVEIRLRKYESNSGFGSGYEQARTGVTVNDPILIQALLDVFQTAKRAKEHNCGNSGAISIEWKDGTVEELEILPGHDVDYYEYRLGGRINKVNRVSFLAALKAIGLSEVKTVPPS